jgi:hypothetical protein
MRVLPRGPEAKPNFCPEHGEQLRMEGSKLACGCIDQTLMEVESIPEKCSSVAAAFSLSEAVVREFLTLFEPRLVKHSGHSRLSCCDAFSH